MNRFTYGITREAFNADQYDYRVESSAKSWATSYDTPAVAKGSVILEKFQNKNPQGMQRLANRLDTLDQPTRAQLVKLCYHTADRYANGEQSASAQVLATRPEVAIIRH